MIIICLRGRFGNQLFQIALGMFLENLGHKVRYDLSAADPGDLDADAFMPTEEYLKSRKIKLTKFIPAPFGKLGILARAIRRIAGVKHFTQDLSSQGPQLLSPREFELLDGFWQRDEYSQFLANYLSDHIKNSTSSSHENEIFENRLVIHIRRGDFTDLGIDLPIKFYKKAIDEILDKHQNLNAITVVTDDRSFCEKNFLDYPNLSIFSGENFVEDFLYLANANYLLLSRSTYSWWAARILNKNVYFPSPWDPTNTTADNLIVPLNWVPVSVH